jgi:hypothetical protein
MLYIIFYFILHFSCIIAHIKVAFVSLWSVCWQSEGNWHPLFSQSRSINKCVLYCLWWNMCRWNCAIGMHLEFFGWQADPEAAGCRKTRCLDFGKWLAGPQQRLIAKELFVGDSSLQCYGLLNWVWLRLEIKQNGWSILTKSCTLYEFRADV